ncbi:MAG: hypothetical protein L7F78_08280 [Syntrophales bacterium LBB04]|nr:hypothetical protein [Syntrophales bacterium LBB04]
METLQEVNRPLRMTRRLLGKILLEGAFVSPDDLQEAIERQRKTSVQLGEILVGMGVLNEADLEAVLSVQRELATPEDTIKAAAGVRELLGDLLIRAKRLTPELLSEALEEQQRTGEKLGSILVRRGNLTAAELDAVLAFQNQQSAQKLYPSPLRLGEILVRTRAITSENLKKALKRQKLSRKKIGEILVEAGYIEPDQLEHGIRLQHMLITAALVGMLSFTALSPATAFDLPPVRAEVKMQINITPVVKARASSSIIRQVHEIVVSNGDIDRGYVEVPAASLLDVANDSPAGDFPVFTGLSWPFLTAQLQGLANEQGISGSMDSNKQFSRQDCKGGVNCRFILAGNAQPGTYALPLAVSASPR